MLSRRLATAARMAPLARQFRPRNQLVMLPALMQTVRSYADSIVKVPQMAESISEGTLKQFNKAIGDYVEQDEEIATIETDKVSSNKPGAHPESSLTGSNQIDVAVNAPDAGTIKEFLANEEDTVTVGQDLVRIEVGGAPSPSSNEGKEADASKDDSTSAAQSGNSEPPSQKSDQDTKSEAKRETKTESEPKEQKKPAASKPEPPKQQPSQPAASTSSSTGPSAGGRDERRVRNQVPSIAASC